MPDKALAMKTIVSTNMADAIASSHGVEMRSYLTGFKYIGEQIGILEADGEVDRFIFGFEESYGYLAGSYVRDKDAVNAAMLICEAAAYYKDQGKTLLDRLTELYHIHGYYINDLMDFAFEGAAGMAEMQKILSDLRRDPPKEIVGLPLMEYTDYKIGRRYTSGEANVLEYVLGDGSSIIVRPSGTEPKLKVYLSAKGEEKSESTNTIEKLREEIEEWIRERIKGL